MRRRHGRRLGRRARGLGGRLGGPGLLRLPRRLRLHAVARGQRRARDVVQLLPRGRLPRMAEAARAPERGEDRAEDEAEEAAAICLRAGDLERRGENGGADASHGADGRGERGQRRRPHRARARRQDEAGASEDGGAERQQRVAREAAGAVGGAELVQRDARPGARKLLALAVLDVAFPRHLVPDAVRVAPTAAIALPAPCALCAVVGADAGPPGLDDMLHPNTLVLRPQGVHRLVRGAWHPSLGGPPRRARQARDGQPPAGDEEERRDAAPRDFGAHGCESGGATR
mmetsp:Transcript_37335/g.74350  ORF Transcript_37335/g.74350 Transcript_37335/m.74350 type:complete len:287 (-) Transcript_37335:46-906(-)